MMTKLFATILFACTTLIATAVDVGFEIPIDITHSDDGRSIALPYFLLQVYETDGSLSQQSLEIIQTACDNFLVTELNAILQPQHAVNFVNTTVSDHQSVELQQSQRALLPVDKQRQPTRRERMEWEMQHGSLETSQEEVSFLRGKRNLQTIVGSQVAAMVNVTFDRVPMPLDAEVRNLVRQIMQDLSFFVSNLTALQDPEFNGVYMAIRLEPPTLAPSTAPSSTPSVRPSSSPSGRPSTGMPTIPPTTSNPTFAPTITPTQTITPPISTTIPVTSNPTFAPTIELVPTIALAPTPTPFPNGATGSPSNVPTSPIDVPGVIDNPFNGPVDSGTRVTNNSLIISSVLVVAAIAAVALYLVWRKRSAQEATDKDELLDVQSDLESSMGGPPTPGQSPPVTPDAAYLASPREEQSYAAGDSVFSGLTDILTDTGSPRLRQVKSMSSATTIKANNFGNRTPLSLSMTNSLFAFEEAEEESDEDDESPDGASPKPRTHTVQQASTAAKRSNQTDTDDLSSNGNSNTPNSSGGQQGFEVQPIKVDLLEDTPLRSNAANRSVEVQEISTNVERETKQGVSGRSRASASVATGAAVASDEASDLPRRQKNSRQGKKMNFAFGDEFSSPKGNQGVKADGSFPSLELDHAVGRRRHHAGYNGKEDGTSAYQNAMHPLDWSNRSMTEEDSTISSGGALRRHRHFVYDDATEARDGGQQSPFSPHSQAVSTLSGNTLGSRSTNSSSQLSASRQLINDLVWLEKKIADVKSNETDIQQVDSLSYVSNDAPISPSSNEDDADSQGQIMQSIVCRDCFAPPGKLQIVIHSTKDGPAVHTVKPGSSLEGHIFPGDLIIAVDNVDTRSYTAEQVMKIMSAKSGFERKITVLHFED